MKVVVTFADGSERDVSDLYEVGKSQFEKLEASRDGWKYAAVISYVQLLLLLALTTAEACK